LLMPNTAAYADIVVACRVAGFLYCPINWHLAPQEIAYQLADCGARVLITDKSRVGSVDVHTFPELTTIVVDALAQASTAERSYDDWLLAHSPYSGPATSPRSQMVYTSGTTGKPKGVKRL